MSIVRLGAFETLRKVGAGGMGTVWEGRHVGTQAPVAIKFLTGKNARTPRWVAAFRAEARAIARLSHPRIVKIRDVATLPANATIPDLPSGSPYIVMEWIPRSLDDLPRPLAWETTRAILLEVLDALAHVHARGVIHRDIKPSNVLGKLGRLRLADFGIASVPDAQSGERMSGASGTPYFMAPEQFTTSAGPEGAWTDLYAVGCLAYLLTTGEPPFEGNSAVALGAKHLNSPFPTGSFGSDFRTWLEGMTAKNPAQRYRFAAEAAAALVAVETAFADPSLAPTDRFLQPTSATETVPLTTVLLDRDLATNIARRPETPSAARRALPSRLPDWRHSEEVRAHVEHIRGAGLAVSTMRLGPFVGREDERDVLWDSLQRNLQRGRPSATVIEGPPGSGRSRLARWLVERAHELGVAPHLGPIACGATDEPFSRMVLDDLVVEPGDDELLRERVEQRLAGCDVPETERNAIVRFLAGKLHATAPRERFDAMRAAIAACAGGRPIFVLLDDVEDSPGVLQTVFHVLRTDDPIHFLMTSARPLPDPQQNLLTLQLGPLKDGFMSRIVRDLAGLNEGLAAEIVGVAAGSPGFAVQLVRRMVEKGQLKPGEHGFELLSHLDVELPDQVSLWRDRLEQLLREVGTSARNALEVGAVLGEEVLAEEWDAVCTAVDVFIPDSLIEELEQRDFIYRTTRGWSFSDRELRRQVIESAKIRNTWKTYVAAARGALADTGTARLARWDLEIGRPIAAARGFIRASRDAEEVCEYPLAGRLLNRAEEALEEVSDDDSLRLRTEIDLVRSVVWGLERLEDADELAQRAATAAREHGWTALYAEALERRARFARKRVDLVAAEELYHGAQAAYEECGDSEGLGTALQGLGMVAVARGFLREAEDLYNEALQTHLSTRNVHGAAWCANGLGDVYRKVGQFVIARSWYERAFNWFEQVGNSYGAMWCVHDLALTKRVSGDLAGAAAGLAETLRMAGRLGQRMVAPRLNLGIVRVLNGQEELARVSFEEVLEESLLRSVPGEEAMARICLLPCDAAVGRWEELTENLALGLRKLGGLVDADLGLMAQVAALHAREAGEDEIAAELDAFALAQGVE